VGLTQGSEGVEDRDITLSQRFGTKKLQRQSCREHVAKKQGPLLECEREGPDKPENGQQDHDPGRG
jgi:hypothetical protein